jgi:zinc transport system ATP-binding protein
LSRAEREATRAALAAAGIEALARRPVAQLSGGQLQRVYLARGLARRPRLLLLDEPATGIDVPGQHEFLHLLEDYRKETGATIVLVTHDWAAARHHASHVALVNRQLVAFGTPGEAMSQANLAAAFGHAAHAHPMTVAAGAR